MIEFPLLELFAILAGVIGASARMFIQLYRDGEWPETGLKTAAELFVGAVAGYLAYLVALTGGVEIELTMPAIELFAFSLGYLGPDAIENVVKGAKAK